MSEPLSTLDWIIVGTVATALVGTIKVLWNKVQEMEKRVRALEASRIQDLKEHAATLADMTAKVTGAINTIGNTMKECVQAINRQSQAIENSPCGSRAFEPHPVKAPGTEVLTGDHG